MPDEGVTGNTAYLGQLKVCRVYLLLAVDAVKSPLTGATTYNCHGGGTV